jgi:hypothetical protein
MYRLILTSKRGLACDAPAGRAQGTGRQASCSRELLASAGRAASAPAHKVLAATRGAPQRPVEPLLEKRYSRRDSRVHKRRRARECSLRGGCSSRGMDSYGGAGLPDRAAAGTAERGDDAGEASAEAGGSAEPAAAPAAGAAPAAERTPAEVSKLREVCRVATWRAQVSIVNALLKLRSEQPQDAYFWVHENYTGNWKFVAGACTRCGVAGAA